MTRQAGLQFRNSFQPIMNHAVGMVLTLIPYVEPDPLQIARSKAHDTVPCLPLQHFFPSTKLLINVVRRAALKLANEFAWG